MPTPLNLGNTPVYVNYNKDYIKLKTKDGYVYDSAVMRRYYSQLDAEIYFCNQYVDEVVAFQFDLQQNSMPLFGYNSYTFDEIALGNRIIQGQFSINFVSPNYLFDLLDSFTEPAVTFNSYDVVKSEDQATLKQASQEQMRIFNKGPLWNKQFDIDIAYGEKTPHGNPVHVIIENVQLVRCQQGFDIGGNPLLETYTFYAKDIKTMA